MTVLNTSQCYLEREYAFTTKLLSALSGLLFVLGRLGGSISHASTDVTKYQWTQTIGQALKYLSNLSINITVHNVNCTMDMDTELPPLHGARSMGLLVQMLQMISDGAVIVREWCHPEAASTIALLFWATADSISDAVMHLQSKDRYIVISDGMKGGSSSGGGNIQAESTIVTAPRERPECTRLSVWNHSEFLSTVTHSIYKCISNASPAPQDMLAGIGRLAGRSENYQSDLSVSDMANETANMLNWCAVAHTITGFKSLLRAAIFSATGDRIALPRQNEWVSAITESLLFCLEFGYRSRNLTLLAPVMAELLLELTIRQSDCSVNVDTMFFDLASHMNKFSDYYKKKSRLDRKKIKKKSKTVQGTGNNNITNSSQNGFVPNLSKSTDFSTASTLSIKLGRINMDATDNTNSGIRRVQSDELHDGKRRMGGKQHDAPLLTIDALEKNNLVNAPNLARLGTYSSSFDEPGVSDVASIHTDFDEYDKTTSQGKNNNVGGIAGRVGDNLSTPPISPSSGKPRVNILQPLVSSALVPSLLPISSLKIANPAGTWSGDSLGSSPGGKKKKVTSGKQSLISPIHFGNSSSGGSNIISSPRAPVSNDPPSGNTDILYAVGAQVDCRITMKNDSKRWFSGRVESVTTSGLHNVRFDDGDLGENTLAGDIRASKRSGRLSARSVRSDITSPPPSGRAPSADPSPVSSPPRGRGEKRLVPVAANAVFVPSSLKLGKYRR